MNDRIRRGRALPIGLAAGALACAALLDLGFFNLGTSTGRVLTVEAVLLTGSAWLVHRQSRAGRAWVTIALASPAVAISVVVTGVVAETVVQRVPGTVGLLSLLIIVAALCRRLPYRLLVFALVPLAAIVYLNRRLPVAVSSLPFGDTYSWLALLGLGFAGWGLYRRFEDARRTISLEQVRQAERLELARDLHDHVAHYVTAMVVVAQAGEQLAVRDPDQARRLFGDLERTGQEGLVAMTRMVRLLRSVEQSGVEQSGVEQSGVEQSGAGGAAVISTLDTIRDQVERFSHGGARVELHVGERVDGPGWSPGLAKSVQRLVQEGLTNVRKHARAVSLVQVSVETESDRLVVRVCDDGTGAGRPRFRPSGFGMVGLSERVSALGGELVSGPRDGGGWQLTASIPGAVQWQRGVQ